MVVKGNSPMGLPSWIILAIYFCRPHGLTFTALEPLGAINLISDLLLEQLPGLPVSSISCPDVISAHCYIVSRLLFSILDPLQLLNKPPLNRQYPTRLSLHANLEFLIPSLARLSTAPALKYIRRCDTPQLSQRRLWTTSYNNRHQK